MFKLILIMHLNFFKTEYIISNFYMDFVSCYNIVIKHLSRYNSLKVKF